MMQKIDVYLKANGSVCGITDSTNNSVEDAPTITRGMQATVVLHFYDMDGNAFTDLENYSSWEFYLADDWDTSTDPMIGIASGITAVGNEVTIPMPTTNTAELIAALGTQEKVTLGAELVGYVAGNEVPQIIEQFVFVIRNRRSDSGTTTPTVLDSIYLTAAGVEALIAAGFDLQFSEDGVTFHDTQTTSDHYYQFKSANSAASVWSPSIELIKGDTGTMSVGVVSTGEPGTDVIINNVGTPSAGVLDITIPSGYTYYPYVGYAEDGVGTNFSTAASSTLKWTATFYSTTIITTPVYQDFVDAGASWTQYIGGDGVTYYPYVGYAEDGVGTNFSTTASSTLKWKATFYSTTLIESPTYSDFVTAGASWAKYIGDDGVFAGNFQSFTSADVITGDLYSCGENQPVGIITNSGNFYDANANSAVTYTSGVFYVDLTSILAAESLSTVDGTWKVILAGGTPDSGTGIVGLKKDHIIEANPQTLYIDTPFIENSTVNSSSTFAINFNAIKTKSVNGVAYTPVVGDRFSAWEYFFTSSVDITTITLGTDMEWASYEVTELKCRRNDSDEIVDTVFCFTIMAIYDATNTTGLRIFIDLMRSYAA